MNERIEKCIDDAKLTAVSEMFESELEKFAELIVRECVDIAHTNADVDETYDYACHTIARKIQEHFGIE